MNRWNILVLAACVGMTFSLPAEAQWKWRDKAGQTQYSDLPPPAGVPEADILQRPASATSNRRSATSALPASAASAAPLTAARASDPELEARRSKVEQEANEKKKAEEARVAASRADNCARAKENLRSLDSGQRMARVNANGEREVLDDAMRAADARRTRDIMASECK